MPEFFRGDMGRMPEEPVTVRDIDDYISDHRDDKAWDGSRPWEGVDLARRFGLQNVLSYFENQCHALKDDPGPGLKEARNLTAFLDRTTRTTARENLDNGELVRELEDARNREYARIRGANPAHEKQEEEIADGNRDAWNEDIRGFVDSKYTNVGDVLQRIEDEVAGLNKQIDDKTGYLAKQDEKQREETLQRIRAVTARRDDARRTRANLLRLYLNHSSMH